MVKNLVILVVVLFFGFWLMHDPHGLAHATSSSAGGTADFGGQVFGAVIKFVHAL